MSAVLWLLLVLSPKPAATREESDTPVLSACKRYTIWCGPSVAGIWSSSPWARNSPRSFTPGVNSYSTLELAGF